MADEEENECCPLCMEELDITDKTFNACPCGYQVCLWCWHQIKNEYNALCPACRAPYSELSKQKSSLDREDVIRRTKQRKQKEKSERRTASQSKIPTVNRRNLANVRVMQRNLVYIIGLPQSVADDDILRSNECFGQYGKIVKAVVNKSHLSSDRSNATASAYITFANKDDALACIVAIDGFYLEGSLLRASFGTTKYCNFFLRNMACNNPDCLYLHELGEQDDSFTKDEMQSALHSSKAAFRDLSTNDIRSGTRFPPPPHRPTSTGGSQRSLTSSAAVAAAANATSAAAAASHASADRQAQSAAAIHKLRQTHSTHSHSHSTHTSHTSHHPDLRRGNSYSRIVTGFASSGSSASSATSSPPSSPSPSPSTPPLHPHASPRDIDVNAVPSTTRDDRKPNLRVDTSVGGGGSGDRHNSSTDNIVGPLEALKLATGSSSQEPAWAMPFPSPSIALQHDHEEASATDPVFSPFSMRFDHSLPTTHNHTPVVHDPWSSSASKSMSPMPTHDEAPLTSRFSTSSSSRFPIGLNGGVSASGPGSAGLSGLSFASIDAIFSQRDDASDALVGMLGVPLAPPPPPPPTPTQAPTPLIPSSPSLGNGVKNARSSRFAFANQPAPSPQSALREPPMPSSRGPPPMSGGLPPVSPYRSLSRHSSFRDVGGPSSSSSSLFSTPNDPRAFPPLGSNAPPPPPPLPPSSHAFSRSTSDPFPASDFGGVGDSNGLAFLQQMLPNVKISYGGDFPSAPAPSSGGHDANAGWGGLGSLGFHSNAGGNGLSSGNSTSLGSGNGGAPSFYDPAVLSAQGHASYYGEEERLRQPSAFSGFRQ